MLGHVLNPRVYANYHSPQQCEFIGGRLVVRFNNSADVGEYGVVHPAFRLMLMKNQRYLFSRKHAQSLIKLGCQELFCNFIG